MVLSKCIYKGRRQTVREERDQLHSVFSVTHLSAAISSLGWGNQVDNTECRINTKQVLYNLALKCISKIAMPNLV